MFKFAASAFALATLLVACGGDTLTTTTNLPEQPQTPTASVAPQPTPQPAAPVADPAQSELRGAAGTLYFTYRGEASRAEVETWGTSFDDQNTPIVPVQSSTVNNGDTVSRYIGSCRQGDARIVPSKEFGGVFFDKNGDPFNPTKNPEKVAECRTTPCVPEWKRSKEFETIYGPWSGENPGAQTVEASCGTRTVTYRYTETNSCTGETRTVDVRQEDETKDCCAATSYQLSNLSYPTYTPAQPAEYYYYWDMNNGNNNSKQNACEGRGGVWLGDDYDIPGDGSWQDYDDVCRTTFDGLAGHQGVDADFIKKVQTKAGTHASGGNPISGSAFVQGAGVWKLVLKATDPGNYEKDTDTVTLGCTGSGQLSVSYNWIGHSSEKWQLLLYRDNVLVASSTVVNNPSN